MSGEQSRESLRYLTLPGRVDMVDTTLEAVTAVEEVMAISSMVSMVAGLAGDVVRSYKWSSTSTSCWLSTCKYSSTPVAPAVALDWGDLVDSVGDSVD